MQNPSKIITKIIPNFSCGIYSTLQNQIFKKQILLIQKTTLCDSYEGSKKYIFVFMQMREWYT